MSKQQLHKRFTTDQVKAIIAKYEAREVSAQHAIKHLGISRPHFYRLVARYEQDAAGFTIAYRRDMPTNKLDGVIEQNILKELKVEKEKIIDNPQVPTKRYNYSYIQGRLKRKYQQNVSVPTIISRAKDHGYWKKKPPKKVHDQEIISNYVGELLQHDSSHHLFAPDALEKWYLITILDDYSRKLLYADFVRKEGTWTHIMATQYVFLKYGLPLHYYLDQHRIFRYVKDRDKNSPWATYQKFTDDVDTQWKKMMNDCGVDVIYALSPQAKGKIERPYRWMQDHMVRTGVREGIRNIAEGRKALKHEVREYNSKRVHSTTGEIPDIRFRRAMKETKSMFREFELPPPFQSVKDIFCLRIERTVDAYRKVSIKKCVLKVPGVMPRQKVELRMYPDLIRGIVEVRFWHKGRFVGSQRVKIDDLPIVSF